MDDAALYLASSKMTDANRKTTENTEITTHFLNVSECLRP